jgi:hypothetical protein
MTDITTPDSSGAEPSAVADTTSDIIDSIVDAAELEAPEVTPEPEPAEPEAPAEESDEVSFPKKAVNAISRRDKQIGKLKAQHEQLVAELERLRTQQATKPTPQPTDGAPREADFETYAEYLEARQDWKMEQKLAEIDSKTKQATQTNQEQAYYDSLHKQTEQKLASFVDEVPDAQSVFDEYADVIDACPDNIYKLFLESGDAPLAAYNLAKQGKLEDVLQMSHAKAAIEIGRALAQAAIKPKTKAPTPLPASRGSVPSGKSLDNMSGDELLKWVKS